MADREAPLELPPPPSCLRDPGQVTEASLPKSALMIEDILG